jgi:PAS domain S-box-containing protein
VTGAAVAGIGFRDAERIWFKSHLGLELPQCSPDDFPAGFPGGELPAPFRLGAQLFRAYGHAPIVTADGYLLGELFVLDPEARGFGDRSRAGLAALVRMLLNGLELRRTLLSYHAVVDGVGHVVFQADDHDRLVSVTPTWSRLTGYGAVRSAGRQLQSFVNPADREAIGDWLTQLRAGAAPPTFECRLRRLIGDDVPVEVMARPLVVEGGRRLGLVGVIADISQRKAREIAAQHAQRMEALGRLASGLAHEINSPMQFLGDNTRFLGDSHTALLRLVRTYQQVLDGSADRDAAADRELIESAEQEADVDYLADEIPPAVQQNLDGVERVSTLVRAMKKLSPENDARAPANLNEALLSVSMIARTQIQYVADVVTDLAELPLVECHLGDLNQVFLNMLVNAADSIESTGERGLITVGTRPSGRSVVITISDNGTGIPAELQSRIFDPFFTTKGVGRGTGQGLTLARSIVHDQHGGAIALESRTGFGSTFTITLPIDGPAPPP